MVCVRGGGYQVKGETRSWEQLAATGPKRPMRGTSKLQVKRNSLSMRAMHSGAPPPVLDPVRP